MRRHALFVGVVVLIAAARFAILLTSQTHVHSDEAIIGLMGKHILEGRYFPFYMYGQPYNAGAAWEAYSAAVAFAFFGVSVISLKACIVVLSLLVLFLFYRMCLALYDQRTALLATIVFALTPSLLKWHFQVRGYSCFFISIPLLLILFLWIQSTPNGKWPLFLLFGIVSGLNIWSLELGIAFTAGLWLLLLLRRGLSFKNASVAAIGFVVGYTPAIVFNLTHQLTNWNAVLEKTGGGGLGVLFHPNAFWQILVVEMPKFFGVDTVLWYYPEKSTSGVIFYAIALIAAGTAAWPFIRSPSKIAATVHGGFLGADEERDLLLLLLAVACFVPYVTAPFRVPGYFLASCFFFAALTGRIIARCLASSKAPIRMSGTGILTLIVITGSVLMIEIGRHNEIETLTICEQGKNYCMTRIAGADLENIERDLRYGGVTGVWTTVSFVYPLLFECGETFAVSDAIFGDQHRVYPAVIPWREPNPTEHFAIVIESGSPFRAPLEARFLEVTGAPPAIREYGKLAMIEAKPR
jgi:4-amino-4-deoxy-L-arabinose transferase-like glycosyltransferase